jgi:hypothetical protein
MRSEQKWQRCNFFRLIVVSHFLIGYEVKKPEESLECAACVKQWDSVEYAREITCSECLTYSAEIAWNYRPRGCCAVGTLRKDGGSKSNGARMGLVLVVVDDLVVVMVIFQRTVIYTLIL